LTIAIASYCWVPAAVVGQQCSASCCQYSIFSVSSCPDLFEAFEFTHSCSLLLLMQATAGSLQSLCWGSSAVGGIMSAYFSGSLVEQYGSSTVFILTAIFPLIVSASALLIDEQRITKQQQQLPPPAAAALGADAAQWELPQVSQPTAQQLGSSKASSSSSRMWSSNLGQQLLSQGSALWGAVKQKHILLPTVFVFLWQVKSSILGASCRCLWQPLVQLTKQRGGAGTSMLFRRTATLTADTALLSSHTLAATVRDFHRVTAIKFCINTVFKYLAAALFLAARRPLPLPTLPCSTSTPMSCTSHLNSWAG
jgi:hypothetical protein